MAKPPVPGSEKEQLAQESHLEAAEKLAKRTETITKNLEKTFKKLNFEGKLSASEREIGKIVSALDELDEHLGKVSDGVLSQSKNATLLNERFENFNKALGITNPLTKEFEEGLEKLGGASKASATDLEILLQNLLESNKQLLEGHTKAEALKHELFGLSGAAAKFATILPSTSKGMGQMVRSLVSFSTVSAAANFAAGEIYKKTIELAKAQDVAISSFRKATGATAEYNQGLVTLERRNFAAGVSAADAGKSFEALFSTFSAFTQLNENQQAAVGDTTALLGELEVAAQTTAGLFDTGMRSMGMSAGQANDMILDLAGSAQTLGVPIDKMASDFAAASGELVKYGPQAIEVFKGLAIQAKNSGLEVSQLLKITKQFDQFDSAGKAVGRLNAILGGPYLNSIDMLNASEEERIDILKRTVDMAGVSFDALNRFEQQAIATSLGMNVEEANKLFRMSDKQYRLDAMKQEELQELARETQEIGQQLKSAFMALAVDLRPLVDGVIVPMVGHFAEVAKWIGDGTNAMSQFIKVGLVAAAIASVLAAPFTGGGSLLAFSAIMGVVGGGLAAGAVAGGTGTVTPRFASGGVVTGTSTAIVGEHGPELVEMPVGSRVTTAPATKQLTDAITKLSTKLDSVGGGPIQLDVYIGREKIDQIVVNALNSPAGKRTLSPYAS